MLERHPLRALALLPCLLLLPALRPGTVFAPVDVLAQAWPWRAVAPGRRIPCSSMRR